VEYAGQRQAYTDALSALKASVLAVPSLRVRLDLDALLVEAFHSAGHDYYGSLPIAFTHNGELLPALETALGFGALASRRVD
jgi:hypothetical protein